MDTQQLIGAQLLLKNLIQHDERVDADAIPLERLVASFLEKSVLDDALVSSMIPLGSFGDEGQLQNGDPFSVIEKWQETLAVLLVLQKYEAIKSYAKPLLERFRSLCACFVWEEFQLLTAYRELCAHLLGQPSLPPPIQQYASGACLLASGNRWSWGGVPHLRFHAELALVWCLYGRMTGEERYVTAAAQISDWQSNLLDQTYFPMTGMFAQEGDVSFAKILTDHFLLFHAIARLQNRPEMMWLAEKQYSHLEKFYATKSHSIPSHPICSLSLLVEDWLEQFPMVETPSEFSLPSAFTDPDLQLAGCRYNKTSVAATLSGGGTGMGCFHKGDVRVVNFGPQHLPLGDCRGFGIEGRRSLGTVIHTFSDDPGFCVEGTVRLAPKPNETGLSATFRNGNPSGFWIDIKQQFKDQRLFIETSFSGLFDIANLGFAFFIKADFCEVEGEINEAKSVVRLRSFDRYQGPVRKVNLRGEQTLLEIEAGNKHGQMQVIPLGGGDNFWGADFLVAYLLNPNFPAYSWVVK